MAVHSLGKVYYPDGQYYTNIALAAQHKARLETRVFTNFGIRTIIDSTSKIEQLQRKGYVIIDNGAIVFFSQGLKGGIPNEVADQQLPNRHEMYALTGKTALHIAIEKNGSLEEVKALVEEGELINQPTKEHNYTALMLALYNAYCNRGDAVAKYLLSLDGINVNTPSTGIDKYPIHLAYNKEILELLMIKGAILDSCTINTGDTVLHTLPDVEHLLQVPAILKFINKKNKQGNTPFIEAVVWGNLTKARILLRYGADPHILLSATNNNPYALKYGNRTLLREIMYCYSPKRNSFEAMEFLLKEAKVDPNFRDYQGYTAIQYIGDLRNSKLRVAELFFTNGVHPSSVISASSGFTILHYAAYRGDVELFKLALKYDGDPKIKDNYGHSAWTVAKISRETNILTLKTEYDAAHKSSKCAIS